MLSIPWKLNRIHIRFVYVNKDDYFSLGILVKMIFLICFKLIHTPFSRNIYSNLYVNCSFFSIDYFHLTFTPFLGLHSVRDRFETPCHLFGILDISQIDFDTSSSFFCSAFILSVGNEWHKQTPCLTTYKIDEKHKKKMFVTK